MNIKKLIKKLQEMEQSGAEVVNIIDNNWYEYGFDGLEMTDGAVCQLMIYPSEEDEESN